MRAYNGIAPRRDMWESYRWSISSIEGHSCGILLANHKGRLHEVRTAVQAVSTTRLLAQGAARRAQVDLQPVAFPYMGNRYPGALSSGDKTDEVPRGRHRVLHEVD